MEIPGAGGYSKKLPPGKWMRDAKINDIFESAQQIDQRMVARRIPDYSSSALR